MRQTPPLRALRRHRPTTRCVLRSRPGRGPLVVADANAEAKPSVACESPAAMVARLDQSVDDAEPTRATAQVGGKRLVDVGPIAGPPVGEQGRRARTIPGVQNPHCEAPFARTPDNRSCGRIEPLDRGTDRPATRVPASHTRPGRHRRRARCSNHIGPAVRNRP